MLKNYKALKVWQQSIELCSKIFGEGELGPMKKEIEEIERKLKAQVKPLENKPLKP